MLCFPNCKINLGLFVTARRDDGYHDIETVFYPVNACDVLEVAPAATTDLHLSGRSVAGELTDNLVWKAYHLLHAAYPEKIQPLAIYLRKMLPMGAGLGGGSADGAFMLSLLNDYFGLSLSKEDLIMFAMKLGSDCPFFIHNTPCFATGRGELMSDTEVDLSAYSIQLICPHVHVSTKAAFQMITPKAATFDLRTLHTLPLRDWKEVINNDFETPVFAKHPALAGIKQQLYQQGAVYAAMSGSGSAIFGIFPKLQKAVVKADVTFDMLYIE